MPDGGRLLVTDRGRRQLGVSVRTVERLVAASRPDKRREARLTTWASYPPIGLEGWAASDPDSPLTGSERPFTVSPARRTNGRTALTTVAHRFHLPCAIYRAAACLLTYTPLVDVGYCAIQRLKTKESSCDTFDEHG
jgi:hypothetical protein